MKKVLHYIVIAGLCIGIALPVFTSEKADSDQAAKQIEKELEAMKERKEQTKCPISGREISKEHGITFMGHRIATCCPNCAKVVKEDPLSAILKIRKNKEEPALAADMKKQTKCPLSGKPVNEKVSAIKNNKMVGFCCPNCKAAYEKEPEKVINKMLKAGVAPTLITLEQTTCPISGHKVNENSTMEHKGKVVKFCCDGCKGEFKASSKKYLQAMADEGIVQENAS